MAVLNGGYLVWLFFTSQLDIVKKGGREMKATILIEVDDTDKITMTTEGYGIALEIADDMVEMAIKSEMPSFIGKEATYITN